MRPLYASLALTLAAAVATATSGAGVPLRLEARILLVEARLDGQGPFTLIVDTGATETVLTPRTAEQLGLALHPVAGAQRGATLRSLAVGEAGVRDFPVYVFDPPHALPLRLDKGIHYHGILGYTFLSRFRMTVDYGRRALDLAPPGLPAPPVPDGAGRVPFTLRQRLIEVAGAVNGRGPLAFLLDTGSAEVLLLPETAGRLGVGGVPLPGYAGARRATLGRLAVGNADARDVPAVVHALARDGLSGGAWAGILGTPFLERFVVTIDYRGRTVTLAPAAGARR